LQRWGREAAPLQGGQGWTQAAPAGAISAIKSLRYGFNRPTARSVAAMKDCGMRAIVGFNLNKLVRDLGRREGFAVAG